MWEEDWDVQSQCSLRREPTDVGLYFVAAMVEERELAEQSLLVSHFQPMSVSVLYATPSMLLLSAKLFPP